MPGDEQTWIDLAAAHFDGEILLGSDLDRVEDLIARMTIQEKAGQLNLLGDPFRFRPQNVNPLDGQGDPARVTRMIRTGETEDHKEAARAFVEKRAPVFKGY